MTIKTRRGATARRFGHVWEREMVKMLKEIGFKDASTSRYTSRDKDDNKIDICGIGPFAVQCKATSSNFPSPERELGKIICGHEKYKVLAVKLRNKGKFAVMYMEDFLELLEMLIANKVL